MYVYVLKWRELWASPCGKSQEQTSATEKSLLIWIILKIILSDLRAEQT